MIDLVRFCEWKNSNFVFYLWNWTQEEVGMDRNDSKMRGVFFSIYDLFISSTIFFSPISASNSVDCSELNLIVFLLFFFSFFHFSFSSNDQNSFCFECFHFSKIQLSIYSIIRIRFDWWTNVSLFSSRSFICLFANLLLLVYDTLDDCFKPDDNLENKKHSKY